MTTTERVADRPAATRPPPLTVRTELPRAALAAKATEPSSVAPESISSPCDKELTVRTTSIWRAGSGLTSAPAIGPDGSVYVTTRDGILDVLDGSHRHRFTITLDGVPAGAPWVDERGWIFVALRTGKVVGITSQGTRYFTFAAPRLRSGLTFAEGQGLLFLDGSNAILGLNRGGYPTMRMSAGSTISAGPIGLVGWCVVATSVGDLLWGDRWGKRKRLALGAVSKWLWPTADGGIWALSEKDELIAITPSRTESFRQGGVVAAAPASRQLAARGIQGVALDRASNVIGLDAAGETRFLVTATPLLTARSTDADPPRLGIDDESNVWVTGSAGGMHLVRPDGTTTESCRIPDGPLLAPVIDSARRRTIVATAAGEIFRVDWPDAAEIARQSGR